MSTIISAQSGRNLGQISQPAESCRMSIRTQCILAHSRWLKTWRNECNFHSTHETGPLTLRRVGALRCFSSESHLSCNPIPPASMGNKASSAKKNGEFPNRNSIRFVAEAKSNNEDPFWRGQNPISLLEKPVVPVHTKLKQVRNHWLWLVSTTFSYSVTCKVGFGIGCQLLLWLW